MNLLFNNAAIPVLFLLLFFPTSSHARINVEHCLDRFAGLIRAGSPRNTFRDLRLKIHAEKRRFLEEALYPAVGIRATHITEDAVRDLKMLPEGNGFELGGFGEGHNVQVVWVDGATKVRLDTSTGVARLLIPTGFDFSQLPDKGAKSIRKWLRGHPLHTYIYDPTSKDKQPGIIANERIGLGEDARHLKQVQEQGMQAASEAILDGHESFLFVAPTGTGKSEVMMRVLGDQIDRNAAFDRSKNPEEQQKARRLQILVADKNNLVDQLYDDAMGLKTEEEYIVFRWGGVPKKPGPGMPPEPPPPTLEEIIKLAEQKGKQVVLVTTVQSLVPRIKEGDTQFNIFSLQNVLSTVAFDEAHHAGAAETAPILRQLTDRKSGSRAFLYGTTATPTHQDVKLISEIFKGHAFWAYLDVPADFRSRGGQMDRDVWEIIKQLELAIDAGELHHFITEFIDPELYEFRTGSPLFIPSKEAEVLQGRDSKKKKSSKKAEPDPDEEEDEGEGLDERGNRMVMDPRHYKNVIDRLKPSLEKHQRGFMTVATKTEAEEFTKALNEAYGIKEVDPSGQRKFAFLHSGLHPDEKEKVVADFKSGKINHLITVRMMDEGINVPELTFFADLTRSTSVKSLLQRIGRILRLSIGKKKPVEVFSYQKVNDAGTAQALIDLHNISRGDSVDADHTVPKVGDKPTKEALHPDHGDIASIKWTLESLKAKKTSFFTTPKVGDAKATEDASTLVEYFEKFDRALDAFARPGNTRIDTRHFNYVEQTLHNAAAAYLDPKTPEPKKDAYFAVLALASEGVRTKFQQFREGWVQRQNQMKTAEGSADLFVDFVKKYGRSPGHGTGMEKLTFSQEEKNIVSHLETMKSRLPFWMQIYERAAMDNGSLPYSFERVLGAQGRFASPTEVAHWMDEFFDKEKRLPSKEGGKFEKQLALVFEKQPEIAANFKNRALVDFHLAEVKEKARQKVEAADEAWLQLELEREQADIAARLAEETARRRREEEEERQRKNIPVFEEKLRAKIIAELMKSVAVDSAEKVLREKLLRKFQNEDPEAVMEPANLRRMLGKPGLPSGIDPDEVKVVFANNSKMQNTARSVLAQFFVEAAKEGDFQANKVSEDEKGLVYSFRGKGVSQYFLDSTELVHRISFKENGGVFTNDVIMSIRPKTGSDIGPKKKEAFFKWRLEDAIRRMDDPRTGLRYEVAKKPWQAWKNIQIGIVLDEIGKSSKFK